MSSRVGCSSAWVETSPLADVSLAWDNFFKAKDVLQRIENKLDIQKRYQTQSQKVRRRLQLERQLLSGERNTEKDNSGSHVRVHVTAAAKGDPNFISRDLQFKNSEDSAHRRKYDGSNHSWPIEESSNENDDMRNASTDMATALHKRREESSSILLQDSYKEPVVSTFLSTYSPSKTSRALGDLESFGNEATIGTEMGSSKSMEDAIGMSKKGLRPSFDDMGFQHEVWKETSSSSLLSPSSFRDRTYVQNLEYLRNRCADRRLEMLKKRIREQRQEYSKNPPGLWRAPQPVKRNHVKQKLRKVTFAPPPPVYKGFSSPGVKPDKLPCDEGKNADSENPRITTQESFWCKDFKPGIQDHKESWRKTKSKTLKPAPGSSHSTGPKKRLSTPGSKLYSASAWREGQKLIRMMLGPPPTCPKLKTTAYVHEDRNSNNKSETVVNVVTAPEEAVNTVGSVTVKSDTPEGKKSCQPAQEDPVRTSDQQPIRVEPDGRSSLIIVNTPESAQEQEQNRSPRNVLLKRSRNCRGSWEKDVSLQRSKPASSSSPVKESDEENHKLLRDEKRKSDKNHSYSAEEIRAYMSRKVAERQKKNHEKEKSIKNALELKKKRLEEVLRKQKDAFLRKQSHRKANPRVAGSKVKSECNGEDDLVRPKKKAPEAWVQQTSLSLLADEDKGSGTLHPKKNNHITNVRDVPGYVHPPDFETDSFSPLKLKDLDCCCSRYPFFKHYLLKRSPSKTSPNHGSPEGSLKSPQHRNKQERVQAIQVIAKTLGDRIDMEACRFSALQGGGRTDTDPDSLCNSPLGNEDEFENKLKRMLKIKPCLTVPSLQSFPLPTDLMQGETGSAFHKSARRDDCVSSLECEKTEAQRENMADAILSSSTTISEELPWNSESGVLDGLEERKKMKDPDANKSRDSAGTMHSWKATLIQEAEKQGITATSPHYGLFSRSPQEGRVRHRDQWKTDASGESKDPEGIKSSPGTKLYSLKLEGSGKGKDTNDKLGSSDENYIYPEKKYSNCLHSVQQRSLDLIKRLKIHQQHQEQELATLRHRAELEAQETQKSFDKFIAQKTKWLSDSKSSGIIEPSIVDCEENLEDQQFLDDIKYLTCAPVIPNKDRMESQKKPCPKQSLQIMGTLCSFKGNAVSADTQQNSFSLGQDPLPTNSDDKPRPFHSMSSSTELPNSETQIAENSGDSSEQLTDSISMWSEISQLCGGPPMFSRFTLEMAQQCLRDEELRARHQSALLRLREEALQEKTRAELSWLEHQKMRLDVKRDYQKVADIVKRQQEILSHLQQEQAEISHLHNIYMAAHQERKLLLKQQRAIERIQRSTAHLQQKLYGSEKGQQHFGNQIPVRQKNAKTSKLPDEEPSIPTVPLNERGDKHLQLHQSKNNSRPFTQNEKTSVQCSPLIEGQSSDAQDMVIQKLDALIPVDPNNDTIDQVSEEHALENRETHDQLNVPLEHLEQAEPAVLLDKPMENHSSYETETCEEQKWRLVKERELEESCSGDIHSDFSGSMKDISSSLIEEDIAVPEETQKEELLMTKEHVGDFSGSESTSDSVLDRNINTAAKLETRSAPSEELRGNLDQTHEEGKTPTEGQEIQVLPNPFQRDAAMVNKLEKEKTSGHVEERSADGEQPALHGSSDQSESSVKESVPKEHPSSITSTESNDSSHGSENVASFTSLPEFQKVFAVLIDVSETSVSLSEAEEGSIQDTDISEPEVSDIEEKQAEAPRGMESVKEENRLLFSAKSKEPLNYETNDDVALYSEDQSNVSAHYTVPELHVITLSNRGTQGEESTGKVEELLDESPNVCMEDYKENQLASERDSDPEERLESSGLLSISLSYSESFTDVDEDLEQNPITPVNKTEMESDVGQCMGVYVNIDHVKTISPVTEELKSTFFSFQPKNGTLSEKVPGAIISSDNATDNEKYSVEGQVSSESDKITPVQTSNLMNLKDYFNRTETCSSGINDLQTVRIDNEKQSPIGDLTSKKIKTVPFLVQSSEDLFPQINRLQTQSEENVTFISDEVLIPIDEDTLSEILSPIDEVLSYQSADLFSIEKDLTFPREDLPSPPEQADSINSNEMNDNTEDFPSPPEQMMESENEDLDPTLDGEFHEEQTLLSDDVPLPASDIMFGPSIEYGNASVWPMDTKNICQEKKDPESQQMGSSCISKTDFLKSKNTQTKIFTKQLKPFLTLSEAEVDNSDPILFYEIGCRVLVKQIQPGTLKYKGYTSFDGGYWAGVALDKPDGDHDGTYKGVRYFECTKNCGIFVRPNEISHLLNYATNSSDSSAEEDPDDEASPPENYKYGDQQRTKLMEQKSKEKYNKTENPSAWKENNSRSCTSMQTRVEIKEIPSSRYQYVSNGSNPQSLEHLKPVNGAAERSQMKGDPTEFHFEVALSMVKKANSFDRQENKLRNIQSLQEVEREKSAEEICTNLTRNFLCDALIAFSETSQNKCKSVFKRNNMKTAKCLGEKHQHKWELFQEMYSNSSEQSSEEWNLNTLKNQTKSHPKLTPQEANNIADKIVAKLIDDAMKEYKKITKRQGQKLENNILVSSGMTQTSLPFLRKLLDAGIFGGSGDFGQLGSVLPTEGIITQRQNLYQLDHWYSAPWTKTEEVAFAVPHNSSYVKKLVAHIVDMLWSGQTGFSKPERFSKPQDHEWEEVTEDCWNAESTNVYNQVISDLTYEVLRSRSKPSRRSSVQPWLKDERNTRCSKHILSKQDVNEIKSFIQEEVVKLLNLEGNDLETKRKLQRITKFENHRRDKVDLLLIQELQTEETEWTEYSEDELAVKIKVTEDVFEFLIADTIEILKKIYLRKTQF
uniref:Coiled-coil domain-containing protein 187 n=1 Tax=Geotrypetes seraphini TaxID=260995 RepID=A0A6P8SHN3_GEOSA|nr:coiled-coil domain-containing protein 187 [Geotrypetes seraphini]